MSEQQTEYETDAKLTPGPWTTGHGGNPDGKPTCTIKTHPDGGHHSGDHTYHVADANMARPEAEKLANARLIAAAGTAASEAAEMGYDPVAAVEALPDLITSVERILDDIHSNDPAEPSAQAPTGEAIKSIKDALTRAEGRNDE